MKHQSNSPTQQVTARFNSAFLQLLCCLRSLLFNLPFRKTFGTEGNEVNEGGSRLNVIRLAMALLLAIPFAEAAAGPRVDIVIGEKAPALERLAADELSAQLKRVYEADVKIGSTAPADAPHVIFVGSPDTNASMKPFANSWPSGDKKLTDQGHLLRSVTHRDRPALLIGGGSPVATYWAVAEFGHRLGIRSLLFGDLDPVAPPTFTLSDVDVAVEPTPRHRAWHFANTYYFNSGCWSLDEFRTAIRQLAKLRFNHITIGMESWQPYLHLEYGGITRTKSRSQLQTPIVVSGDTLGRKAFGGAKLFEYPAFAAADTYDKQHAAAKAHLSSLIETAHGLGMEVTLSLMLTSYPSEFAKLWQNGKASVSDFDDSYSPHLGNWKRDPQLVGLTKAWIRSAIDIYPEVDRLLFAVYSEDEEESVQRLVLSPSLLKRKDGRIIPALKPSLDQNNNWSIVPYDDKSKLPPTYNWKLDSGQFNVLPSMTPSSWESASEKLSRYGGYEISPSYVGDDDLVAYWLSRRSGQPSIAPKQACRDLVTSICGEEVDHRVWQAVELVQSAAKQLEQSGSGVGLPKVELNLKQTEAPPAAWSKAREDYLNAMNEMYRANTRAREGGRAYTLYLARRFEFAYEYLNYAEAVRKSAIAEQAKDHDAQVAEIEKAIESLNSALNAMAAITRGNSDRDLIAMLNEYGYRPLKKKLAEAEAAK